MIRPPAEEIATVLREIQRDKLLTLEVNGKRFDDYRRQRMNLHITTLDHAIEGFDNLARLQAQRAAEQEQQ